MSLGSRRFVRSCSLVLALILLGASADVSQAALALLTGGGYSGTLSKNRAIRKQQLICDPAGNGAPTDGSTSVDYDPTVVSLAGFTSGPGYFAYGKVAVNVEGGVYLQDIYSFLEAPLGPEVGYVQVAYEGDYYSPAGTISPPTGYTTIDNDGVVGFDTHAFDFAYLASVSDATIAHYKIYAAPGDEGIGSTADYLAFQDDAGNRHVLDGSMLTSAFVSGNLLDTNSVPLPASSWAGGCGLTALAAGMIIARRRDGTLAR